MKAAGAIGAIVFLAILVLIIMGIRYLIALGVFKASDMVAGAFRDKNADKYKESEKTSLAVRYENKSKPNEENDQ